jgi:hypothetical protein
VMGMVEFFRETCQRMDGLMRYSRNEVVVEQRYLAEQTFEFHVF